MGGDNHESLEGEVKMIRRKVLASKRNGKVMTD